MRILITMLITVTSHLLWAGNLLVQNEMGQPIVGAQIFIGDEVDTSLVTDVNGSIKLSEKWNREATITVKATSYLPATFVNLAPIDQTLQLQGADNLSQMEIQGDTTQFQNIKKDGKVDVAMVYPALTRRQIAQFDISSIISSEFDTIRVVTETVSIPSNITLPKQTESYIVPVSLNKPKFRMTLRKAGTYRMVAAHAQFPVTRVVNELRAGKPFYEIVNHFNFIGGGQREVVVNGNLEGQDIPVNQMTYDSKIALQGPTFDSDKIMFSVAMVQQGNLYFSTDVKRVETGQALNLAVPSSSQSNSIVSILLPKDDLVEMTENPMQSINQDLSPKQASREAFKYIFTRLEQMFSIENEEWPENLQTLGKTHGGTSLAHMDASVTQPTFLDLVPRPKFNEDVITMTAPTPVQGIRAVATQLILSEIEKVKKGDYTLENKLKVWELSQLGWATEINLPTNQFSFTPGKTYRWEVIFLGSQSESKAGEHYLDGITHVSRNSVDF